MRRQRNMAQMKEQVKTPGKDLNEMEISTLSDAEFKTLFIRMIKEFSEELSSIKKTQSETKGTLIEIKTIYRKTTVEWMKPKIKSMIWNIRNKKNNHAEQEEKRIHHPKMKIV